MIVKSLPSIIAVLCFAWIASAGEESLDPFAHLSGVAPEKQENVKTFSNTQQWDSQYTHFIERAPTYLPKNWRTRIAAEEPPKNFSPRTRAELAYLVQLQKKRTTEDIERIKSEITLEGFKFGAYEFKTFADKESRPEMAAFAHAVNEDIASVMFQAKNYFDRVRPSILEPTIRPCIKIPGHPAYPSGHSTQAFAWAYLLMEFTPAEQHDAILTGAKLIAQDRELAGVHYPSDTALGQRIARQVVDMWLVNPKFVSLLKKARTEWQAHGEESVAK